MPKTRSPMRKAENHLIESLPREDRRQLQLLCESVELKVGDTLYAPNRPVRYVYFPIESFISLAIEAAGHPGLEVGMVGREGILGGHLALGLAAQPLCASVQRSGSAWRIRATAFRRELARSPALRDRVGRYLYVRMGQMARALFCMRFHQTGPRLARWLLMSQDRAHSVHLLVTHECLSAMLGVRRVGITVSASTYQREGLIRYRRGALTVLDRAGLERAACCCYAADCNAYSAVLA